MLESSSKMHSATVLGARKSTAADVILASAGSPKTPGRKGALIRREIDPPGGEARKFAASGGVSP